MKIISGGQTGADRAALDAALKLGLDYGGWIPRGRRTEAGALSRRYQKMEEMRSPRYPARTIKNLRVADATLIFCRGRPSGGTALTIRLARKYSKPHLLVDLRNKNTCQMSKSIRQWLDKSQPIILNVAGPRESKCRGIYKQVLEVLLEAL